MATRNQIKEYWNKQARLQRPGIKKIRIVNEKHDYFIGFSGQGGTLKDPRLRDIEIETLIEHLPRKGRLLDAGCGNGYTTTELLRKIPKLNAVGVDYADEMIRGASKRVARLKGISGRAQFMTGDMTDLGSMFDCGEFDIIVTVRSLMNLESWQAQKKAISQLARALRQGGLFLMMEGSLQARGCLNKLRSAIGLPPFLGVWHNLYLDEKKLLPFLSRYFVIEEVISYSSTYLFLTRCVLHTLRSPKKRWNYSHPMFRLARQLPNEGQCGFHRLFRLRRKKTKKI
ncbi:MAG: class I SAM-dependent methyltransferase [Candidatus Omnitrophica bacterium]|nr:class I SAM-dependent methyltransferase [Candidatus Omnitrophota bacterium]